MAYKMRITIEIPDTGLEEGILRKGEWEDNSLFGRSLRNALMHFTKESYVLDQIRAEIEQTVDEERKHDKRWAAGLKYAAKIVEKYKEEDVENDKCRI